MKPSDSAGWGVQQEGLLSMRSLWQLVRYGLVGIILNLTGYLLYLWITSMGADPLLVVTALYPVSVTVGYFVHRRYSFNAAAKSLEGKAFAKYVAAYVLGYVVNMLLLDLLWRRFGIPHQWVQAAAIFIVAGMLFLILKFFVWRET